MAPIRGPFIYREKGADRLEVEDMDVWKNQVQQDINDLKQEHGQIKNDVAALKINDKLQDSEISYLRDMLKEIRNDTQWIRRKVTGAIINSNYNGCGRRLSWYCDDKIILGGN